MTKQTIVKQPKTITLKPTTFAETSLDGYDRDRQKFEYISDSALKQGVHIMGGPGSGKSRMLGRVFALRALIRHEPLVVIDPTGAVIDNALDKVLRLPFRAQQILWSRIRYIDASAREYCVPTPIYYHQSKFDTLYEIANRLPGVFERQDPDLHSAPILGFNALEECAVYSGQIATALGRQLDFVIDLIDHPHVYKVQLRDVLATHPELKPAVDYFREMMDPTSAKLREKRTGSFKNKLLPFLADPTMLAMYAGTRRCLNWEREVQNRKVILIDLRHERDPKRRQVKMIWYLKTFMDYIKDREMGGRGNEVMLIIDEITDMLNQRTKEGQSILAGDLEELITRHGRQFGVNVVVAHQNLTQIDERIQNVLMQMGTQLIGVTKNPDDALRIARQFLLYNPYWVKKTENVWMSVDPLLLGQFSSNYSVPVPTVIDHRFIEFSPDEQTVMLANKLQSLGRFRFLAQVARGEGEMTGALETISIARLDQNLYPNKDVLTPLRRMLAKRDGVPVETLLAEIRARSTREKNQKTNKHLKAAPDPARLDNTHVTPDHLPVTPKPAPPVPAVDTPAKAAERPDDEPVFQ